MLQLPRQVRSAIGGGGRLPGKILAWQGVIALVLLIVLGIAKHVVATRENGLDLLNALPGGRMVTAGVDIGGMPTDYDLEALETSYHVDGVVNLNGPNVAEQVAAASLHLGYLRLAIAPGAAPTLVQLHMLANFMQSHVKKGNFVYLHDDLGGGRVVAAACMLLVLRGASWSTVQRKITSGEHMSLSRRQSLAVEQLSSALRSDGQSIHNNPYSGARINQW